MTDLLPLRRRDPVSQPGDFVPLQRMRQRRTPHRTGTVPPAGGQVRLSKLGNRIDLLINLTEVVPDRASAFQLPTTQQNLLTVYLKEGFCLRWPVSFFF